MSELLRADDYRKIANYVEAGEHVQWAHFSLPTHYLFEEKVVPKGRPRFGKGGRAYTPPETRKFEQLVKEWGMDCGMRPVHYPLKATLAVYDKTDKDDLRTHGLLGLVYYQRNDLDNIEKAVFDALNKVAYADDKQLIDVSVRRRYSSKDGFRLTLSRAGLSKTEYTQLLKFL